MYFLISSTVPASSPQNTVGTAPTSRSISLQWDPPPIEDQNGIIMLYQIDVTEVESGRLLQYTSNETSITVFDLHPFYTYQWVVSAATAVGYGPFTETSIVITLEDCKLYRLDFGINTLNCMCIYKVTVSYHLEHTTVGIWSLRNITPASLTNIK